MATDLAIESRRFSTKPIPRALALGGRLLRIATSRRTALLLMALFLACLAVQAMLPQRGAMSPVQYALWQAQHPVLARGVNVLGFDSIATTPWFWALGFALAGSLAMSALRRAVGLLHRGHQPRGHTIALEISPARPLVDVAASLRRRGYALQESEGGLIGRKRVWSSWGSIIFHGGLVMLFLGVLVSVGTRFTGFVELAPGQTFQERSGYLQTRSGALASEHPEFTTSVLETGIAFWPDDTVKDVWARVIVQETGNTATKGTIRRNQSVRTGPSSVTLGSPFGPAVLMRYAPASQTEVLEGYVHFAADGLPPRNTFVIPGTGLEAEAELVGPWQEVMEGTSPARPLSVSLVLPNGEKGVIRWELALGETVSVPGGELSFVSLEPWVLFMVSRDSGLRIIVVGGLVALIGLSVALFIVPKWLYVLPHGNGWRFVGQTPMGTALLHRELDGIADENRVDGSG